MRISLSEFPTLLSLQSKLMRWDTNALFAAAMPLDRLNEWAESIF